MSGRTGGGGANRQGGGRYDRVPVVAVHPRPTPARSGLLAAPRRTALIVLATSVFALVALLGATPASARSAQDPGDTTPGEATSTTVAGFTTELPATTVAPETDPTADPAADTAGSTGTGSRRVADENRKIWAVVGGLVLVAIALSLLTIRYWRKTKPVPPTTGLMLPTDAALAVALASTPEDGEPGSPAAPALDAAAEPEEPVPAAAWVPHDDLASDAADDTAPVPVVEAAAPEPDAEPGAARRAVAGADHATADEAWEPRGTGEHQRVVVASTARANRLSPEQRAALFAQREPKEP